MKIRELIAGGDTLCGCGLLNMKVKLLIFLKHGRTGKLKMLSDQYYTF